MSSLKLLGMGGMEVQEEEDHFPKTQSTTLTFLATRKLYLLPGRMLKHGRITLLL